MTTRATVQGWTFVGTDGGVYVDVIPPGCRSAVDVVYVDREPVQDILYLADLGRRWLREESVNLAMHTEAGRYYDRAYAV